ncbi:Heat Labile Enterotoxin Type Iib, partial [Metarhizium majus ARSEF 297]
MIALYGRGLDAEARQEAGIEAFHWAIHITPEGALEEDKSTTLFHVINQEENTKLFKYEKRTISPFWQRTLFARIKIGKLPSTVSVDRVDELLSQVQWPNKMENPSESCVSWAICGVRKLQDDGLVERFDTAGFADKVVEYGEARLELVDGDDADGEANPLDIDRYDAHQGKIVNEPKDASLPCKRAGVPCVNINAKEAEAESKGPTVEKAQDGQLMAEAGEKSKESFNRLLEEYNYGSVAKQDKLYTELSTRLPEFTAPRVDRIAGFTNKIAGGALAIAGLALYGKAVADVFSSDASVLDKAAVVTSILPGIGCAVRLAADQVERGRADAAHTALCFAEDALLVAGFWEIALAMQVSDALGTWIRAENERSKFWDGDVLAQKGGEGWDRLLAHLKGDDFLANATTQFATYQILTLFQASQLTGDLHAAHRVLSENATSPAAARDQGADVGAHVRPELRRQICATIAEAKHQLRVKLEGIALNHTVKLEREFKNRFLDEWFKAGTSPAPILGVTIPDLPHVTKHIQEQVDKARNTPLPLYEEEVKAAVKEVMERLETPAPCRCEQGRKRGICEFGDCQGPKLQGHPRDAGGRVYVTGVPSLEMARRVSISESCQALFTTCQSPGSAGETARPLWCTPG